MSDRDAPKLRERAAVLQRSPVESLLLDAVLLAKRAASSKGDPPTGENIEAVFARASILSSAVALEAAANLCLIRVTRLPDHLRKKIERFPTMDRFDFILSTLGKPVLDRGSGVGQRASALISKVRNKYVHPTLMAEEAVIHEHDRGRIINPMPADPIPLLDLPGSSREWATEHAVSILRLCFEFLDHFLIDCCGYSDDQSADLIHDATVLPDGYHRMSGPLWDAAFHARKEWMIKARFFSWLYSEMEDRGVDFSDKNV